MVAMSRAVREMLLARVDDYGSHHALRCLALAYRSLPPGSSQVARPDELPLCCACLEQDLAQRQWLHAR